MQSGIAVKEAARAMLLASTDITGIVGNKIFPEAAPPTEALPYILIKYMTGGDDNLSYARNFDIMVEVCSITRYPMEGEILAGHIDTALVRQLPIYPGGWNTYVYVTTTGNVYEPTLIESKQFWSIGGIYRFRGSKR